MIVSESRSFAHHPYRTAAIVFCLLILFGVLSYTAVLGKSATYDEPLHAIGGEVHHYLDDYRINPEDPALFGWWSSLPHSADAMPLDKTNAHYEGAPQSTDEQWWFVVETLYSRGAAVADSFLNTSRLMFVLVGIALGALIALWAFQLGGGAAAIAACTLFCLDPNMLAHSAMVKNDVPLSMFMCLLGFATWHLGRRTIGKTFGGGLSGVVFLILTALACALALNVKFSAVLFFPMLALMLLIRALMPNEWKFGNWTLVNRWQRIIFAGVSVALALLVTFGVTWNVYGFRYSATATAEPLNSEKMVRRSIANHIKIEIEQGKRPAMTEKELEDATEHNLQADQIALPVRVDLWMQSHHILPEGWLFGFLYTYATTLIRSSFLMGAIRERGWFYYFPAAMLFKTPTATLLAALLAPFAAILSLVWLRERGGAEQPRISTLWQQHAWAFVTLSIPPGLYFVAALFTNLNLGLRHILPVYPYVYVALGWAFSLLWRARKTIAMMSGGIIAFGLLLETALAYPNYLAFFNAPSGGSRGGIKLLGDSNLDWGQDLPALARWQHEHPAERLNLCYFGMANPAAYGLDYVNIASAYPLQPPGQLTAAPGVFAISATDLQGIYMGETFVKQLHALLHNEEPLDVLNGTIYLYRWPPPPSAPPDTPPSNATP